MEHIRTMLNDAVRRGLIPENPIPTIERFRAEKRTFKGQLKLALYAYSGSGKTKSSGRFTLLALEVKIFSIMAFKILL